MLKKLLKSVAVVSLALSGVANAAYDLHFENLSGAEYDTAGVFVTGDILFTGSVDDGGGLDSVLFNLWDDGIIKFSQTYSLLVGSSGSFHFDAYYPGLVQQGAQGVGLYLEDSGFSSVQIDPYNVPHYKDPSHCTHDCGPTSSVPEPSGILLLGLGLIGVALRRRIK